MNKKKQLYVFIGLLSGFGWRGFPPLEQVLCRKNYAVLLENGKTPKTEWLVPVRLLRAYANLCLGKT